MLISAQAGLRAPADGREPEDIKPDKTLGVVYTDGRKSENIPLYRLERPSEEMFISAFDLARIFNATRYWNSGARKLVLRIDNRRYLFTLDTRVVVVDGNPALMRIPVRYANGSVMIPLEFISLILPQGSLERIDLDEQRFVLTIGSPQYNITDLYFEGDEEASNVTMVMSEGLLYHIDSETPGLLRLKVYGGRLNTLKMNATEGKGLFNRVRAEQTEHDSYLFFDVKKTAERYRVEFLGPEREGDGRRKLMIHLQRGELPEIPDVEFAGRRMTEIIDETSRRKGRNVRKVAIDPGHGGIDKGKVGGTGLMEKEVNLEIAFLLKEVLERDYGIDVVMTRTEDVLVPLSRRAEIANEEEADIFVSLHCNGWFHPDAGGFETFFLSPARTEEDIRLAMEENASIDFEEGSSGSAELDDLGFIIWDMVQNEFISESSELAEMIQREVVSLVQIRNRGVKQAGLIVLRGCMMPAVLVEVAFLSNPEEEELVRTSEFRRKVVSGIAEAISHYRSRFESLEDN
jgi:N-acetylmuramoyl-L-alanine amidase